MVGKDRIGTWQNWEDARVYLCSLPQSLATSRAHPSLHSRPQIWYRNPHTGAVGMPPRRGICLAPGHQLTHQPRRLQISKGSVSFIHSSRDKYSLSSYSEQGSWRADRSTSLGSFFVVFIVFFLWLFAWLTTNGIPGCLSDSLKMRPPASESSHKDCVDLSSKPSSPSAAFRWGCLMSG